MSRYYDSDGSLHGEYTSLSFYDSEKYKQHLETIYSPKITRKIVDYEMDIFAEEFGERWYFLRLIDKLRKQFYGKSYTSQPKKYSLADISNYHDQWYSNGNRVAWDTDTYTIVDHNIETIKSIQVHALPVYEYQEVLLEWLRNHVWTVPHDSITDVVVTDILQDIFTTWDIYQKRYNLGSYYTQWASCAFDDSYVLLKFSAHTRYNITPEFIQSYKEKVKRLIITDGYWSPRIPIGLVCKQEQLTTGIIIQLLDMIDYDYLKKLLDQIDS